MPEDARDSTEMDLIIIDFVQKALDLHRMTLMGCKKTNKIASALRCDLDLGQTELGPRIGIAFDRRVLGAKHFFFGDQHGAPLPMTFEDAALGVDSISASSTTDGIMTASALPSTLVEAESENGREERGRGTQGVVGRAVGTGTRLRRGIGLRTRRQSGNCSSEEYVEVLVRAPCVRLDYLKVR